MLTMLLLNCRAGNAQNIQDIMDKTSSQREKGWEDRDFRRVHLAVFANYFLFASEKYQNQSAFSGGYGGGLRLFVPVHTSGDGTVGDDYTGDITLTAAYTNWSGSLSTDLQNLYPDLNDYTALLGYRFGLGGILFFEPQVGYTYGVSAPIGEGTTFQYPSKAVSGPSYSFRAGLSILKWWDMFVVVQATTTTQFGTPVNFGAGMDIHLKKTRD